MLYQMLSKAFFGQEKTIVNVAILYTLLNIKMFESIFLLLQIAYGWKNENNIWVLTMTRWVK